MERTCQPTGTIVLLAACAVFAQAQNERPAYEAASVKLNTSGGGGSTSNGSKGQVLMVNQTLKRLIERAYTVKPFQVSGPDWMENIRFDIAAKYPPDTKSDDRPLMLRTLLEDRFKLAVHRETKDLPGYSLVVAKGGFKLKPVEPGGEEEQSRGGTVQTLTAKKMSMAELADFVARRLGVSVADKTGIDGVYDIELRWSSEDENANVTDPSELPSLFSALQETLGLRLAPQKVPVEIVVVDHVERVPIEN
jgi:uncharacterized protein (TIGR03435 family)